MVFLMIGRETFELYMEANSYPTYVLSLEFIRIKQGVQKYCCVNIVAYNVQYGEFETSSQRIVKLHAISPRNWGCL